MALSAEEKKGLIPSFFQGVLYKQGLSSEAIAQKEKEWELLAIKTVRSIADKFQHDLSAMLEYISEDDISFFTGIDLDVDFNVPAPTKFESVMICVNPAETTIKIDMSLGDRRFDSGFCISHLQTLVDFIIANGEMIDHNKADFKAMNSNLDLNADTKVFQIEPSLFSNFYKKNKDILVKESLEETREAFHDFFGDYLKCFKKGCSDEEAYVEYWVMRRNEYQLSKQNNTTTLKPRL